MKALERITSCLTAPALEIGFSKISSKVSPERISPLEVLVRVDPLRSILRIHTLSDSVLSHKIRIRATRLDKIDVIELL